MRGIPIFFKLIYPKRDIEKFLIRSLSFAHPFSFHCIQLNGLLTMLTHPFSLHFIQTKRDMIRGMQIILLKVMTARLLYNLYVLFLNFKRVVCRYNIFFEFLSAPLIKYYIKNIKNLERYDRSASY